MEKLNLPPEFEIYRSFFEKSILNFVSIEAILSKTTTLWDSKLGGYPYLPQNFDFPKDSKGKNIVLLAQINFEEVPELEYYPKKGILQFYISGSTDFLYGANFDNPTLQKNFRVIYFAEIEKDETKLQTDFSFLGNSDQYYEETPFEFANLKNGTALKLNFSLAQEPAEINDYRFDKILGENTDFRDVLSEKFGEKYYDLLDTYIDSYSSAGHKIGGYADFTQEDPRSYLKDEENETFDKEKEWLLLLQIDSDENIMWGDVGICNFFIRKNDLLSLNFENVWYNWDCH